MEWHIEQMPGAETIYRKSAVQAWLGEGLRQVFLFPVLNLFAPTTVYGLENLVEGQTYIFAANHASHADAPLLLAALPRRWRMQLRVAAAADYFFDRPWKGAFVSALLNAFPFVRKGPHSLSSLWLAGRILDAGHSLLIFPEGSRAVDGQLQPFKRGVGRLAVSSGAAVVPVYIKGAHTVFPKGARWPRRNSLTITFGAPLRFGPERDPEQATAQIEQTVRELAQGRTVAQAA